MRIGVLDLLALPCRRLSVAFQRVVLIKQYAGVTPQAISVWCRQMGHRTCYATYYGLGDPSRLLPPDLDVVMISSFTATSSLAYALAKIYRERGALTVLGGPHAKSFPTDSLRFFDLVVKECNKELISDILAGHFAPGSVISSAAPFDELPSVEERMPEIRASAFWWKKRRLFMTVVPMLASTGCPYACDFCIDWKNPYRVLPSDRVAADLAYLSKNLPGVLTAFHDPNFGVKFDQVMALLEAIPPGKRPPYIMEASLSILRPERIRRLRETNCVAVAPGIESWMGYSNKAGAGGRSGMEKVEHVSEHLRHIHEHVPYIQANLIFGLDTDMGEAPVRLTKEFLDRTPFAWPLISTPIPLGGTPMYDEQLTSNRILPGVPFSFYFMASLVTLLKHYDPITYYTKLNELMVHVSSATMLRRRLASTTNWTIRTLHCARTASAKAEIADYRAILGLLRTDHQFRAFHEGRSTTLPEFYHRQFDRVHGRFAELLSREERRPVLEPPSSLSAPRLPRRLQPRLIDPLATGGPTAGPSATQAE